ncbi:MAG: type II toxin-antitoxin system HicB family antitoxin [Verrucomicrobiae bacterium]|nr:type II toxin-antitoxin system HicB family antitoxin [Verrucomicrobiae bacterium]
MVTVPHRKIEIEREDDSRRIFEMSELFCVLAYETSSRESVKKAEALSHRAIADRLEHGELTSTETNTALALAQYGQAAC